MPTTTITTINTPSWEKVTLTGTSLIIQGDRAENKVIKWALVDPLNPNTPPPDNVKGYPTLPEEPTIFDNSIWIKAVPPYTISVSQ